MAGQESDGGAKEDGAAKRSVEDEALDRAMTWIAHCNERLGWTDQGQQTRFLGLIQSFRDAFSNEGLAFVDMMPLVQVLKGDINLLGGFMQFLPNSCHEGVKQRLNEAILLYQAQDGSSVPEGQSAAAGGSGAAAGRAGHEGVGGGGGGGGGGVGNGPVDAAPPKEKKSRAPPWSPEELALYEEGVRIHGEGKWSLIAQHVGTRTASQVRGLGIK